MPIAARKRTPPAMPAPMPALAPVDRPGDGAAVVLAREGLLDVAVVLLAVSVFLAVSLSLAVSV